jgi:hypothetical protein
MHNKILSYVKKYQTTCLEITISFGSSSNTLRALGTWGFGGKKTLTPFGTFGT